MQRGPLLPHRIFPKSDPPYDGSASIPPTWVSVLTRNPPLGSGPLGHEPLSGTKTCPVPKEEAGAHACSCLFRHRKPVVPRRPLPTPRGKHPSLSFGNSRLPPYVRHSGENWGPWELGKNALECQHPEFPSVEGVIQPAQIKYRTETPILLWN